MRERSKNLRKLVKPLQGRDRETRGAIRGAIPRTHIIHSRGYAELRNARRQELSKFRETLRRAKTALAIRTIRNIEEKKKKHTTH